MSELKPCPFCGKKPEIRNDGIRECRNKGNGDLITKWKVWCPNCGIVQEGGVTEYYFRTDETLSIRDPEGYDGRKRAIEKWNRRAGK